MEKLPMQNIADPDPRYTGSNDTKLARTDRDLAITKVIRYISCLI